MVKFKDHPEFFPLQTPKQMLQAGVFGGTYFNKPEHRKDIDPEIFDMPVKYYGLSDSDYLTSLNKYKVRASKPQEHWDEKGWIHPDDPRGWVQWYFRFYCGRRHPDDSRQIGRWRSLVARHQGRLISMAEKSGMSLTDMLQHPDKCKKLKQTLLHWGFDGPQLFKDLDKA